MWNISTAGETMPNPWGAPATAHMAPGQMAAPHMVMPNMVAGHAAGGNLAPNLAMPNMGMPGMAMPAMPNLAMLGQTAWHPKLDAWENDAEILIEFEMAGVDPDSIEIEMDASRHSFTVQGKKTDPQGHKPIYRELPSGSLARMVPLPFATDELEATFAEGILQVRIPKPAAKQGAAAESKKVRPKKVSATYKM